MSKKPPITMEEAKILFESMFVPCPMSGCWLWVGGSFGRGYGGFYFNGTHFKAHRFSLILYTAIHEIPLGAYALHKCDNKACVNPDHLYIGDASQNLKDVYDRGLRAKAHPAGAWNKGIEKDACARGHLRSEHAYRGHKNKWVCRACAHERFTNRASNGKAPLWPRER